MGLEWVPFPTLATRHFNFPRRDEDERVSRPSGKGFPSLLYNENEAIGLGLDDLFYLVLWIGTRYFLIPYLLLHRVICFSKLDFLRKVGKKKGRWREYNYRPKTQSRLFHFCSQTLISPHNVYNSHSLAV
jgi:hypothetical protein